MNHALDYELSLINNDGILEFTKLVLDATPPHFWTKPSSAGKYHPHDEHGIGGLVLHTKRVCQVAEILISSHGGLLPDKCDIIRSSCILHDVRRYGDQEEPEQYSVNNHDLLSAELTKKVWLYNQQLINSGIFYDIYHAILSHMGRWGKYPPNSNIEWIVHESDNIASKYIPVKNPIILPVKGESSGI